ncbi:MAG: hypothetical protein IPG59_05630 [Candidatus Melainabacteria bacterium]|nr:MAG: hypothetical protein IPG59_05630 [Candidatus Melainabacteria bacterium]
MKRLVKRKFVRSERGVYVVELLIALALGALMSFALLNTLSESLRLVTSSQNQTTAHLISSELLEWSRAVGYEYLKNAAIVSEITINRTSSNEPGSDTNIRDEVLMLDDFSEEWSEIAKAGKFRGKVTYQNEPGGASDTRKITVIVEWVDNTTFGANSASSLGAGKRLVSTTIVRKSGTKASEL